MGTHWPILLIYVRYFQFTNFPYIVARGSPPRLRGPLVPFPGSGLRLPSPSLGLITPLVCPSSTFAGL